MEFPNASPFNEHSEKGKLNAKQHPKMLNKMIKYMAEKARKGADWEMSE
jgi:hypothetical protein